MEQFLRMARGGSFVLSILAARKLSEYESGTRVPATVSAIADAIRWAKEMIVEIDRH